MLGIDAAGARCARCWCPGALPMIFTGLRLSLQASWTTLVAAELVGALAGLGQVLNQAQQDIYPGDDPGRHDRVGAARRRDDAGARLARAGARCRGRSRRRTASGPPRRRASLLAALAARRAGRPSSASGCAASFGGLVPRAFLPAPCGVLARSSSSCWHEPFAGFTLPAASAVEPAALRPGLPASPRVGRHSARAADGVVPLARRHRHADLRRAALHRADRLGAVCSAVVRHRHRRADADHLHGRVSAAA